MFPSQRPGAVHPLQSPTEAAGVVALPDLLHSDTPLYSFPVSPVPVLDVPAQLHLVDLVILQHLVGDSPAVVVVLVNTVQAKISGFSLDQPKTFFIKNMVKVLLSLLKRRPPPLDGIDMLPDVNFSLLESFNV